MPLSTSTSCGSESTSSNGTLYAQACLRMFHIGNMPARKAPIGKRHYALAKLAYMPMLSPWPAKDIKNSTSNEWHIGLVIRVYNKLIRKYVERSKLDMPLRAPITIHTSNRSESSSTSTKLINHSCKAE